MLTQGPVRHGWAQDSAYTPLAFTWRVDALGVLAGSWRSALLALCVSVWSCALGAGIGVVMRSRVRHWRSWPSRGAQCGGATRRMGVSCVLLGVGVMGAMVWGLRVHPRRYRGLWVRGRAIGIPGPSALGISGSTVGCWESGARQTARRLGGSVSSALHVEAAACTLGVRPHARQASRLRASRVRRRQSRSRRALLPRLLARWVRGVRVLGILGRRVRVLLAPRVGWQLVLVRRVRVCVLTSDPPRHAHPHELAFPWTSALLAASAWARRSRAVRLGATYGRRGRGALGVLAGALGPSLRVAVLGLMRKVALGVRQLGDLVHWARQSALLGSGGHPAPSASVHRRVRVGS
jgi:hypothetical protein